MCKWFDRIHSGQWQHFKSFMQGLFIKLIWRSYLQSCIGIASTWASFDWEFVKGEIFRLSPINRKWRNENACLYNFLFSLNLNNFIFKFLIAHIVYVPPFSNELKPTKNINVMGRQTRAMCLCNGVENSSWKLVLIIFFVFLMV